MFLNSISDFLFKNVENKLLFRNDFLLPLIIIGYILFATQIGPSLMENRKAFSLRRVMVAYNFFEVGVNFCTFLWIVSLVIKCRHIHCLPHDDPRYLTAYQKTLPLWWCIFLNKMFQLFDTVFSVLRKKRNQLSFIWHHSVICILVWWMMRDPSRTGFYCSGVLGVNMLVHTAMYTYLGLSCLGPHMAKHLWWKKYLTALQIGQFVFDVFYVLTEFLTGCERAGAAEIFTLAFIFIQLIMFFNFYKKKYSRRSL